MRTRSGVIAALALSFVVGCTASAPTDLSDAQRAAIADTVKSRIVRAYDLSAPGDPVARLMSLYPPTGRIVSASGGQLSTSRDTLESEIRTFWENVGRNMREPKWIWGPMQIDVLAADAAVVTTTYRVSHLTPRGEPHVIAGAWTAVFQRRQGTWVIVQEHLSDLPASSTSSMPAAMHDAMSHESAAQRETDSTHRTGSP